MFAQNTGTLRGQIQDETGAVIPGVNVTATGPTGFTKSIISAADGTYVFTGLPPGSYSIQANSPGLTPYQSKPVDVGPGAHTLNIQLKVASEVQQVTVQETIAPTVTVDPESNASQIVLKPDDLKALSDDPDDLEADLQALAGPSAGPDGGQIYVDGFTGGNLPPKESIREVRINSNPFSSEYDRLGFGRIEILTKPGADQFRGQGFFNISDGAFNSRNPYLTSGVAAPFQSRNYGGNVGGPLGKKVSFFVDFERRDIDDDGVINAQTLDPATLQIIPFSGYLATPQRRTTFSPRIDYQLNDKNTLTARYSYLQNDLTDNGVGNFNLASRGYDQNNLVQQAQLTDTYVVNAKTINETRFRYQHIDNVGLGNNSVPSINVLQAFNGGGSQAGYNYDREDRYELQNYTSIVSGRHAWKFGVRARGVVMNNLAPTNFGGTFSFAGGLAPILDSNNQPVVPGVSCTSIEIAGCAALTSIQQYQRTLLLQRAGFSPQQIRALGGGASQFSMAAGTPFAQVNETDLGFYVQDDWKVRPDFTLSLGLRYEWQTNIHNLSDLAPRLGFAWAPGGTANKSKFVVRGGFGIFYSRFDSSYTLQAERYNGVTQQQYIATNPDFFPNIPPLTSLQLQNTAMTTVDKNLQAPYVLQTAIGFDRQLPFKTTLSVNYTNSRALHLLLSRDINAPLAGTYDPSIPGSGVRPYGNVGEINQFESAGVMRQNQMFVNLNSRASSNLTLFAGYVLNYARSNTDGATWFPANQYDLAAEYGRSFNDIRNRMYMGGSWVTKWNLRFSPFITARSGAPYNLFVGSDLYGDTLLNTARPAFASDPNAPGMIVTPYGVLDPNPKPGEKLVPRDFGNGPGFFSANMRVSKTFGFGAERNSGGGASGAGMAGSGGHSHPGGGSGDALTSRRYNLTVAVQARNLLNTNNEGPIIGDVTSPLFGTSNRLAGGYGAESNPANNRRIEFQMKFAF